jgi:hypothetical protein
MSIKFAALKFKGLADGFAQNLLLELAEAALSIATAQVRIGTSVNGKDWQTIDIQEGCRDSTRGHQTGQCAHPFVQGTGG